MSSSSESASVGPHLKVELRRLRRGLDGRFGFDLSRFCAGCWGRLGRVLRRGRPCPVCARRVCKRCRRRPTADDGGWICVLCYGKKFTREEWWHDDANLQRFKGSQGKTGTYLLRLTDWSSHGALDPGDGPRVRSVSDAPVRTSPVQPLRPRSETYSSPTNQLDEQLSSRLGRKWKLKWKLLAHEAKISPPDHPQPNGNLQYTSSTLKRKRREIRESSLMLSSKAFLTALPAKADTNSHQHDQEWSLPFLPDTDGIKVRHSVRGAARLGRRGPLGRSASLPTELHQEWALDQEFWRAGFVQTRVRRLEQDLATVRPDSWSFFWNETESQSLCSSLELGRIVPDGDDYRIAYLSSAESSLEYVACPVACRTLDRKDLPPPPARSEEWDFSLSSADNRAASSSDEDEFEYFLPEDCLKMASLKNVQRPEDCLKMALLKNCQHPEDSMEMDSCSLKNFQRPEDSLEMASCLLKNVQSCESNVDGDVSDHSGDGEVGRIVFPYPGEIPNPLEQLDETTFDNLAVDSYDLETKNAIDISGHSADGEVIGNDSSSSLENKTGEEFSNNRPKIEKIRVMKNVSLNDEFSEQSIGDSCPHSEKESALFCEERSDSNFSDKGLVSESSEMILSDEKFDGDMLEEKECDDNLQSGDPVSLPTLKKNIKNGFTSGDTSITAESVIHPNRIKDSGEDKCRKRISVVISCKSDKSPVSGTKKASFPHEECKQQSLPCPEENIARIRMDKNEYFSEDSIKIENTSDAVSERNTTPESGEVNNFTEFSRGVYDKKLRNLHSKAKVPEDLVDITQTQRMTEDTNPYKNIRKHSNTDISTSRSLPRDGSKSCRRSDSFKKNLCCIRDGNWCNKYEETSTTLDSSLVELVTYEPLSTPFAAIYAISYGRYPTVESYIGPENARDDSPVGTTRNSCNSGDIWLLLDEQRSSKNTEQVKMNGYFSDLSPDTIRPWSHSKALKRYDQKLDFSVTIPVESIRTFVNNHLLLSGLLEINKIDIDNILFRPVYSPILGVSVKYSNIRSFKSQTDGRIYLNRRMKQLINPRRLKSVQYASERISNRVPFSQNGGDNLDREGIETPQRLTLVDIDSFYLTDKSEHDQIVSKGIRKLIGGGIRGRMINFTPTPFAAIVIPSCRGEYRLRKTRMLEILTDETEPKRRIAICFLPLRSETEKNQVTKATDDESGVLRHAPTSRSGRATFAGCLRRQSAARSGKERTVVVVDLDYLSRCCCGSVDRSSVGKHVELDGPTQALLISILRRSAMADESPRSIGKVARTQGKNISKLMKLFDNNSEHKNQPSDCSEVCVSDSAPLDNNNCVVTSPLDTQQKVSNGERDVAPTGEISEIPYCRKVEKGGLWDKVDISGRNDELWEPTETHNGTVSSYETSTAELNDLIASSRAELSKKAPSVSDRSNLEEYFTSFESPPRRKCDSFDLSDFSPVPDVSHFPFDKDPFDNHPSMYDCEMNFDEEDPTISDTSSEEELRFQPDLNYLPAYALHTIIEESCEESERDSRTATPTNNPSASKLERYFSWDIINDADLRKKQDDESTIYSDSLSEHSEEIKDVDPTHMASSRLEKYFTSGLVDDQNYFYPDDAEFVDDAPVSDFEEDHVHLKISRSALLSSLETKPPSSLEEGVVDCEDVELSTDKSKVDDVVPDVVMSLNAKSDVTDLLPGEVSPCEESQSLVNENDRILNPDVSEPLADHTIPNPPTDAKLETIPSQTVIAEESSIPSATVVKISPHNSPVTVHINTKDDHLNLQKPVVKKDHLANDIQGIIKKLLSYFSEDGSESLRKNLDNDYMSAWQLLETEIERLLQSIPSHTLDSNSSCNSSTIDSNNSDYGSDTIESLDCMTDDDDTAEPKIRLNTKCPPPLEFLGSSYNTDLSSFNISDETLSIWKRLIHSLQKDNALLSENRLCDPTAEARLYIKDQIVTLMHTVRVHDSILETDKEEIFSDQSKAVLESLIEENPNVDEINEAFNVNLSSTNIRAHLPTEDALTESKTESSSDEGISVGSTENVHSKADTSSSKHSDLLNEPIGELPSPLVEDSFKMVSNSSSSQDQSSETQVPHTPSPKNKIREVKQGKKESDLKFSVFVDIELDEDSNTTTKQKLHTKLQDEMSIISPDNPDSKSGEMKEKDSDDSLFASSKEMDVPEPGTSKSSRDTGYFSFKSSDDSLLNTSTPSAELLDVPNFKSLKRTVKKFQISNTLSKSTNNILQNLSVPDTQFSTLQLKPKKVKEASSSSRQFSSLFSPSAMLKRFTGAKSGETSAPESSIPPKYLKKYARSTSVDNESLFGAVSMPHLNNLRPGDSYSELGLYNDRSKDSCLTLDEDTDPKRYFSGSQSVLSLGAHSASMTSVYSASGCHYGYVTVTGDVLFGLNYNQKSQMMEVFVKQCRNLAATDTRHNKSSPYVKVYLLPDKTRSGKRKTKTKKNTLNPVFNELLRFPVAKNELESRTLWLSVWNSDLFGRNDFLGEISLPLGYRLLDSPTLRWYPLQERVESLTSPLHYKGELFLALKYVPRDLSLEARFRSAPVISQRGALHVLIKEARNITRSSGTLDAFCKSYLLPDKSKSSKQKTPVVRKSGHPKWYYTVVYEDLSVDELRERSLELSVWHRDKLSSNDFVGAVRLNIGNGLYHGVPVEWMDSRRDESSLWQTMLDSPNMWVDGCLPLRPAMQFHSS